jgi:23S rRNA (uracil1939-C5)-methyltransferase
MQHAADPFIARWKRDLIATALAARGLSADIRETVTSPPGSRRRVVLAGRRTRKGVLVGFHGRADNAVVPVTACAVADPRIVAALPTCGRLVEMLASRKGEVRLSVTVSAAGLDVAVEGGKPLDGPVRAALGQFAGQEGLARLSVGGETVAMRRPPEQAMGRARVVPPPGGFLQATPEGEAALVAAVTEAVGPARRAADLFAGSGTFALPLAERTAVHAVESDAAALAALDAGWRRAEGLKPVTTERRDLFQRPLLAAEFKGFDAAVFDPPRAGAEAQAAALAKAPLGRLAAVSCNPATFARDARLLADGGWRIDWVLPVDQFRWSPHVELVAAFRR